MLAVRVVAMAHFVLIHGSGQSADSWARVRRLLESRGHAVSAPDLPKEMPEWGLEHYAARIAEFVRGPETIVVTHSYCGAFLPLVPDIKECGLLVFFAAVIPEPGKSIRDQFSEDPAMFNQGWIDAGAKWFDKTEREGLAREYLFHDCDDEALAFGLDTIDLVDTRHTVAEPCPLVDWPSVPAVAIVATDDRTLTPDWCRRAARERLGVEAIEIEAGHCPHISRPEEVARLLEDLATTSAAR